MKAVVLVGGFGTRLRPLTNEIPKQMLPVVGRPMIEHVLEGLHRHGITEAVLSLGFRPDVFTDAYPDGRCGGVQVHYAVEPEPLDTAGAIGFAAAQAGIDERFVAVNGDVFTDLDLGALLAFHDRSGAEGTIALTPVDDPSRYGVVPTDDDGRVLGFIEKPPAGEAPTNWINAGSYVLEPEVLARIARDRKVSIEREVFPAMVDNGVLFAQGSEAYWVDAGTPATYLSIQLDLISGVRGPAVTAVAADADVDDDAAVTGSVIGSGARVESGAVVERSMIGAGVHIAADCIVRDSVVADGSTVGAGSHIVDRSIIGFDQQVGDGTRLTEGRLPDPDAA